MLKSKTGALKKLQNIRSQWLFWNTCYFFQNRKCIKVDYGLGGKLFL